MTASQTNITSLGNLTSLSIAGTSTHYGSATFNGGITGTLQTASQPNITTLAGVTSIGASSSTTLTGILQTAAQTNITSVGSLTTLNVLGNTTIGGNLTVTGSITTIGNVNNITITGNAGQFFGNVNGFGALYAGIGTGYFIEPQTTFQISSNYNGYAMLNMQNVNSGPLASSDLILTPNNGSANDTFFDIGVASSTYNYPGYSLIKPNDGYLIAYGNATIGGGNLILSTGLANDIIFAVNGTNTASEFGRVQASSNALLIKSTTAASNTTSGALQVAGGLGVAGNLYAGNVSATYIVGNGSLLTGLPAGYANTNVAAYLPGYTGASGITSVGTLTGLTVSGLVNHSLTTANTATAIFTHGSDGNFQLTAQNGVGYNTTGSEVARFGINYNTAGWDSFTQYVRGASSQNGYQSLWASNTPIANVTSSGVSVTGTVSATTFSGAGTSLTGTASSLTAGAVTNGFYTTSSFNLGTTSIAVNRSSATQSLTGINIDGSAGSVPASGLTGSTLASGVTASSLTSVGTLTGLTTSGTITTKTPVVATALSSANYGAIEIPDPSPANSGTNYIIGYHQTSTLSGYGYRQHLSIGQKRVASNQWGAAVIAVGGNDGYPTVEWLYNYDGTSNFPGQINGTVFAGKATSAQYADLAEIYSSDKKYVPGTVVVFGGDKEITISTQSHDPSIAGVVSTDPAYLMNSEADGLPIALQGRVPCRVQGPVKKGDRLVSSDMPGIATVMDKTLYEPGCIIGKALEDITDDRVHTIEVVVGRV